MRRRTVIYLLLILAALAWPAWEAWRWGLALRVYADPETPAPTLTSKHVAALRKLRFDWNTRIESGGPVVDPAAPYGSGDMAADLAPIIGTRDRLAIARFHREVCAVLVWALENGELADGQYRLAHLDNAGMEQRLRRDLAGLPAERIAAVLADLPQLEPDGYFRFTGQHRQLLRALRFEWPDVQIMRIVAGSGYPAPAVNFKRPFGDMTAFEIDMASVLGLPRPSLGHVDPLLNRLYWDMWPALQTFVEHATIDGARSVSGHR
jgi:hypothetical protein